MNFLVLFLPLVLERILSISGQNVTFENFPAAVLSLEPIIERFAFLDYLGYTVHEYTTIKDQFR